MAIILVSYDLKSPTRNYQPVHDYLKRFTYCKGLESVWLLDTSLTVAAIRDGLRANIDANDVIFVTRLAKEWASYSFGCADWLSSPGRDW